MINNLKILQTIFWDFDGVIKESVAIKSEAFEQLFLPFGKEIARKVKDHHELNGGISRYNKLPIYLNWAGKDPTVELVEEYAKKFSFLVKQKVIDSQWVPGVLNYLKNNYKKQQFFLITATPQQEIEEILKSINIYCFFKEVIGSPIKKSEAVKILLNKYKVKWKYVAMIGDSSEDCEAAINNKIYFILRKTELNIELQRQSNFNMISDFL